MRKRTRPLLEEKREEQQHAQPLRLNDSKQTVKASATRNLQEPFPFECPLCFRHSHAADLRMRGRYQTHFHLAKHLKLHHPTYTIKWICGNCGFESSGAYQLKMVKLDYLLRMEENVTVATATTTTTTTMTMTTARARPASVVARSVLSLNRARTTSCPNTTTTTTTTTATSGNDRLAPYAARLTPLLDLQEDPVTQGVLTVVVLTTATSTIFTSGKPIVLPAASPSGLSRWRC